MWSTLKDKNLLLGSKFFSLRVDPNEIRGMKNRVPFPESVPINLKYMPAEGELNLRKRAGAYSNLI